MADRIGIIHEGRLVAAGTMEELHRQSGNAGALEQVFLALTRTDAAGTKPLVGPSQNLLQDI